VIVEESFKRDFLVMVGRYPVCLAEAQEFRFVVGMGVWRKVEVFIEEKSG
jgi:hypothetical protein